jgi:hypothetical protein
VSASRHTVFAVGATAAVLAALVAGMVALGSPAEQRTLKLDQRRVADLQRISAAVDLHWTRRGSLPPALDALSEDLGRLESPRDPDTGAPYEYVAADGPRYRLCATFSRESTAPLWGGRHRDFWAHGPGRHCFEIDAERVER